MIFRRPSLGWAKAKLPARVKPASAEIADRITAPPHVPRRITIRINRGLEALLHRETWCPAARAPQAAAPPPRRLAWLRIFVVRCSLPCDPRVGVIHAWRD